MRTTYHLNKLFSVLVMQVVGFCSHSNKPTKNIVLKKRCFFKYFKLKSGFSPNYPLFLPISNPTFISSPKKRASH